MFGTLPPYMSLLCETNFDPLNICRTLTNFRKQCGHRSKYVIRMWIAQGSCEVAKTRRVRSWRYQRTLCIKRMR